MTALSTHPTTVSEACKMLEKQLLIECDFDGDVQTLGVNVEMCWKFESI